MLPLLLVPLSQALQQLCLPLRLLAAVLPLLLVPLPLALQQVALQQVASCLAPPLLPVQVRLALVPLHLSLRLLPGALLLLPLLPLLPQHSPRAALPCPQGPCEHWERLPLPLSLHLHHWVNH